MKDDYISLHPERMLDPHLCYCPNCGGESPSLTVGHLFKAQIWKDPSGADSGWVYADRGMRHHTARKVKEQGWNISKWQEVAEGEKIPGEVCENCEAQSKEFDEIVKAGGIYWRCKSCRAEGVIKAEADIAKKVRLLQNVPRPAPIGIEFATCEEHGGSHGQEEEV